MVRQIGDYETRQNVADAATNALKAYLFIRFDQLTLKQVTDMLNVVDGAIKEELSAIHAENFAEAICDNRKQKR